MIFWITLGLASFISLMIGMIMIFVMHPDILPPGLLKTKVAIAAVSADWPAYFGFLQQASGALGIILFGFIISWNYGREYSDRTVKDLLALPVSRVSIFSSKLLAVFLWCVLLSVEMYCVSLAIGFLIKLPLWDMAVFYDFTRIYFFSALLSYLLCPAFAFVASAGRGFLPAIGFLILSLGLANFFGTIGWGAYFPWAIPMLYTQAIGSSGGRLALVSYIILFSTGFAGTAGTLLFWKYADQSK